jgi:hypothetical protein
MLFNKNDQSAVEADWSDKFYKKAVSGLSENLKK